MASKCAFSPVDTGFFIIKGLKMVDSSFLIQSPLEVEEVISCFKERWGVTYDLQLIVRNKCLYIQIMWGYLEQKSFPMDEVMYKDHISQVLEIINRLGLSNVVREWLNTIGPKPRIGRALSLKLKAEVGLDEFVL